MSSTEPKKCAHPACLCMVKGDEKYCSTRCDTGGDQIEISCDCGHPGCALDS